MAKRKRKPEVDTFAFLELQLAVIQHCQALKAITELLERDQKTAAVARLDGAVAALHAVVRGQCAGKTMKCPACGTEQDVVAWVDDRKCNICGEELDLPAAQ